MSYSQKKMVYYTRLELISTYLVSFRFTSMSAHAYTAMPNEFIRLAFIEICKS